MSEVAEWVKTDTPRLPSLPENSRRVRAYLSGWPDADLPTLTGILRDPQHHPRWLPVVLDMVRTNAEMHPGLLQAALVTQAASALPPLPAMAVALWQAVLDGIGPLSDWIPRGARLRLVGPAVPPAWCAAAMVPVHDNDAPHIVDIVGGDAVVPSDTDAEVIVLVCVPTVNVPSHYTAVLCWRGPNRETLCVRHR